MKKRIALLPSSFNIIRPQKFVSAEQKKIIFPKSVDLRVKPIWSISRIIARDIDCCHSSLLQDRIESVSTLSVWPDLAKFRHFGKFLTVYFLLGKLLSPLWLIYDILGQIFFAANGQILKNYLTVWSHCSLLSQPQSISLSLTRLFQKCPLGTILQNLFCHNRRLHE